tara:strand:+ start:5525 stop:6400 length:876 start_codon:yes stop_codon:yes gene_type:complete
MKKIFDNFYILSKFSLNFILLICVFFLIYILFVNYRNQDDIAKTQLDVENKLKAKISENSEHIKNFSKEIEETKRSLSNIENIIKKNLDKESKVDLSKINESISVLNNSFDNLNEEIASLKNTSKEKQLNNSVIINQSIKQIVELIMIKYENNLNFDKELNYLEANTKKENIIILEKISVLKKNKYKGHFYLEEQFNTEVDLYLKNMMNTKNNFLNKFFLPYINLSPSSENIIIDDNVSILEEIKVYIKNRNIEKAFKKINKIEQYETYFTVSFNQMKNYNNFYNEISRIK